MVSKGWKGTSTLIGKNYFSQCQSAYKPSKGSRSTSGQKDASNDVNGGELMRL